MWDFILPAAPESMPWSSLDTFHFFGFPIWGEDVWTYHILFDDGTWWCEDDMLYGMDEVCEAEWPFF